MAAAPQQGGGSPDNSYAILWGIAALFAVLGGTWYLFRRQIIFGYLNIKLYEIGWLNRFTDNHYLNLQSNIQNALQNAQSLTFDMLGTLGAQVGVVVRYPFMAVLILLAFIVFFSNSARNFRRTYDMKSFANAEAVNWYQINPVVRLNLLEQDIDQGAWAMALTPIQFCKRYKLLLEVKPERREGMARSEWDRVEVVLKRGSANKFYAMQLGAMWTNVNALPPHVRALFAVFAARLNADTKPAVALLKQLSMSSTSKLNIAGTNELLKKHEKSKLVQQIVSSHAYVFTVMASMLVGARTDGVQASADFLWVKPIDRRLWYILNSVGRQTPFAEIAGIFSHWLAEKEAGRKLLVPMVESATNALEIALKEVVYRPDGE